MCRRKVNPSERDKKRNREEAGGGKIDEERVIKKMRAAEVLKIWTFMEGGVLHRVLPAVAASILSIKT